MKFYTGPEDLKDVIERYIVIGNDMAVYYLNNRKVSIPNFTEELNVNTLDDFSYSEVKEVHKKLKKVK